RPAGTLWLQAQIHDAPIRARARSVPLHAAERPLYAALNALAGIEGHQSPPSRHQVYQALECRLYRVQVFVDVRVIELHRAANDGIRKVVQELRSFVEEGGIVFIAFKNKVLALAQRETAAEVFRDPANQKRRPSARARKHPRQ